MCQRAKPITVRPLVAALFVLFLAPGFGPTAGAAAPDTPGAFRHEVYSDSAAELFWSRSNDDGAVVGYEVRIDGEMVATRDATSWFTDTLNPGRTCRAEVRAVDDDGERSSSATLTFVGGDRAAQPDTGSSSETAAPDPGDVTLAAPTGLRATVYSRIAAELFWNRAATPGLRYEISRNDRIVATTDGISHYDDSLVAGRTYRFDVVALDSAGGRSLPSSLTLSTPGARAPSDEGPHPSTDDTLQVLAEPAGFYESDGYGSVNVVRLDVRTVTEPGPCTVQDGSGCTLDDVYADIDGEDEPQRYKPKFDASPITPHARLIATRREFAVEWPRSPPSRASAFLAA